MATTLTAPENETMTHFSFPISKSENTGTINPVDGTPDIEIWGKATDGTLDSDLQVVDPEASLRWIKTWYDTKGNIRMAHDPKKPVGKGIEIDGHNVRAMIADPVAKHLVRTGVLNDFSIGICMPDIRVGDPQFSHLDPQGKAVRGVITDRPDGLTSLGEISIVDRGSNYGTQFQLAKAAADGTPEWVGKMYAPDDVLAGVPDVTKAAAEEPIVACVSFSPTSLAKLLEHRRIAEQRETETTVKAAEPGADEAGGDNARDDEEDEPGNANMDADDDTDTGKTAEADEVKDADPDLVKAETAVYKRDIDTATRRRLAQTRARHSPTAVTRSPTEEDLHNAATLAPLRSRRLRRRQAADRPPLLGGRRGRTRWKDGSREDRRARR